MKLSFSRGLLHILWLPLAPLAEAQLTNPLPDPLPSGLNIGLNPWITIPKQSGQSLARINHLKVAPGGSRLFCIDLNGMLWVIASDTASSATGFLAIADYFPELITSSGLGTGFTSFTFHPEFATPDAPGYGKFYTAHS